MAEDRVARGQDAVLIVVDVQNGFVRGGSLAVPGGDEIVPLVNRIARRFANVVLTQDWHTPGHVSFASSHPGKRPFDLVRLPYGDQVLWPDHCVQGTASADFAPGLDSYSAFQEADRRTPTGLGGYLRQRGLGPVFVAGLATDFCVAWTAIDARREGFETYVVEDACRAIDADGSLARAWTDMAAAGVRRMTSANLPD